MINSKKSLKTNPFQETLNMSMCGPASLKIVFAYYNLEKTEEELARLCNTNNSFGTNEVNLRKVAKHFGFNVVIKNNSSLKDIEHWITLGVPVIVDWFTRGRCDYTDSSIADGHYSVVDGIDNKYIYLQDPEIGKIRRLELDDFMKVWFDFSGEYINKSNLIIRQLIAIYK